MAVRSRSDDVDSEIGRWETFRDLGVVMGFHPVVRLAVKENHSSEWR